ncbi:thiosulfate dehydrogenase [quinone] large subunit [Dyadobacter koreensis]|uniref:Thiosulfate dehydrogenase [quinone] large subunit n=1 Tax=Dyadobacter koreensis TaxID=408657 RepID=A0A1H6UTX2_9BACT|nr:DoxX family membrane protein [Dyadobacter koreensis]SEI95136.1 thiosulfate dehydrogenase [quinone] large subunit [Dyadobacter koreensis]
MISSRQLSFVTARLAVGMSMFGHGLVRLPKLSGFSNWMAGQFQKSMLPDFIITPFSYMLPVAEFIVGTLLLLGLFTRQALTAGALVMISLIFGSTMIESWDALPSQLIHTAFFSILLSFEKQYNAIAVDKILERNRLQINK